MRKSIMLALGAAALAIATPSFAAGSYQPGYHTPPGTIVEDFSFGGSNGTPFTNTPTETATGDVRLYHNDTAGEGVLGLPAAGDFLSILAGGTFTIDVPDTTTLFSFIFGTLDSYNSVVFNLVGGGLATFTGGELTGGAVGSCDQCNGLFSYSTDPGQFIASVTFSSTQTAFEITDLAIGTPEPATWLMMILGFGLAGAGLRRSKRKLATA